MGLAVDDAGGLGAPVVCLPMLGMSRLATAMAFGPALAGTDGVREVYLDLLGRGDSPGEGPADSQTILAILCAWLECHFDRPALLAGSSYGAYLAAGIARQRPELVGVACCWSAAGCGFEQTNETSLRRSRWRTNRAGWTLLPPSCTATWIAPRAPHRSRCRHGAGGVARRWSRR